MRVLLAPLLLALQAEAVRPQSALPQSALPQAAPATERVSVTVLATTDMHGFHYPWDYFTRQKAARRLAAAGALPSRTSIVS